MPDLVRSFDVYADNELISGYHRGYLSGRDAVGLLPCLFVLRLWNLGESDLLKLRATKTVSVINKDSVLGFGYVSDVYRKAVPEGTITEITFSPEWLLWNASVSLAVNKNTKISESVTRILESSGTGIPLLSFLGDDPVKSRGQSFFGRASECINTVLSTVKARGYLNQSGVCIVPNSELPITIVISEPDLLDIPSVAGNLLVLRTNVVGWPLGKAASVKWRDQSWEGIIIERSIDADTMEGNWQAEILMEIKE